MSLTEYIASIQSKRVAVIGAGVRRASEIAAEGDTVILSPACAAFDRLKNFAERGNTFKQLVMEL